MRQILTGTSVCGNAGLHNFIGDRKDLTDPQETNT